MIKKILNISSILLIVLTCVLWFYTQKKDVPDEFKVLTIKTNYMYLDQSENMNITLFLNSKTNILEYKEENSFSICDNLEKKLFNLEVTSIIKGEYQKFEEEKFYQYTLVFKNPNFDMDIYLKKAYLKVSNERYQLKIDIGSFEYKKAERSTLNIDFNEMYGVFNDLKGMNTLVGIVVSLVNKGANY